MHWVVLLTPMPHKPIAIVAILTIYHNLQYHRLIWFHNQKYATAERTLDAEQARLSQAALKEKYGAAEMISRRLLIYIACGIVFGLIYQGPRQLLGYASLQDQTTGTATSLPIQLGISFLWGYAFIHYYLDSKIWRVRRDVAVGQALKMDS